MRRLIVNADDLGLSAGINCGIFEAHDRGIVTSASLMVLQGAADSAAAAARERPRLRVGLHVDVGEWAFVQHEWRPVYERAALNAADALLGELHRQLDRFHELVGSRPTHIDSHQHAHTREPLRSIVRRVGSDLRVPVRHESRIRYLGAFYGQTTEGESLPDGISIQRLVQLVSELSDGTTELACHPGYADDVMTTYRAERAVEIRSLCHAAVRMAVERYGVELCSFADVGAAV